MRFLRHDSGLDPVFGRLTHIGASPPRDTLILFAEVPSFPRSPPQLPAETFTFLQDVQMAST